MKRINWVAINPQKITENTFWAKTQEDKLASDAIFKGLDAKFTAAQGPRGGIAILPPPSANKESEKNEFGLRVMNKNNAQNILILHSTLLRNVPYDQLKRNILRCDTDALGADLVKRLIEYMPTTEQMEELQKLRKNGEQLVKSEDLYATLGEIDGLLPRLQSMNFKASFAEMVKDVEVFIHAGSVACKEVRTSKKFAKIIELVLLIGNYMNSGLNINRAYGFDISFMTQIKDVKDSSNRQTLLHFLAETIETMFPELLNFGDELPNVEKASGASLEYIQGIVKDMKDTLNDLNYELNNYKGPQSSDDKFDEVMRSFAAKCNSRIEYLERITKDMEKCYKDLGEYFIFDTKLLPSDKFFEDILNFKQSFMQALKENTDTQANSDVRLKGRRLF